MKRIVTNFFSICVCMVMLIQTLPVHASNNITGSARGIYMSSANVYATVDGENDIIGNAHIICLAKVKEIDVDMYLQRAYGNEWKNVSEAYNMNLKDVVELDEYAIIHDVAPGTYRVYIEVNVTGYDGLWDTVAVGTGSFTINT